MRIRCTLLFALAALHVAASHRRAESEEQLGRWIKHTINDRSPYEAAGAADVLVPNHFELEVLAGRPLPTLSDVVAAADGLRARGCRIVVVTSLATAGRDAGTIANLVVTGSGAWTVTTPKLGLAAKGAGDALAALFLGRYLDCGDAADALAGAVSSVYAVIEATAAAGARELLLVAAQNEIVAPTRRFRPCRSPA